MSDVSSNVLSFPAAEADGSEAAERLLRTLRGRRMVRRLTVAADRHPSPEEGLALVAAFVAIEDPDLRQALLDVAGLLAASSTAA